VAGIALAEAGSTFHEIAAVLGPETPRLGERHKKKAQQE
jgi:hypothetical protein